MRQVVCHWRIHGEPDSTIAETPVRGGDEEPYDGVISLALKEQQQCLRRMKIPLVNTMYFTASSATVGKSRR